MEEGSFLIVTDLIDHLNLVFSQRARAIRFRQDSNEAVGGFFSQIGQLYMVHHLWGMYLSAFLSELVRLKTGQESVAVKSGADLTILGGWHVPACLEPKNHAEGPRCWAHQ